MATPGHIAADPRRWRGWLLAAFVSAAGLLGLPVAGSKSAPETSRYRVDAVLRPADSRFALAAEVRPLPLPLDGGNRFALKQINAPDVACEELGDAIFADGFE